MGYSRDYNHYPPEMRDAISKVFNTGEPLVFTCPTAARAQSVRGQFYAYFRALREAAYKEGLSSEDKRAIMELYRLSGQITVKADGTSLIVELKSSTVEMQSLREVLMQNTEDLILKEKL